MSPFAARPSSIAPQTSNPIQASTAAIDMIPMTRKTAFMNLSYPVVTPPTHDGLTRFYGKVPPVSVTFGALV